MKNKKLYSYFIVQDKPIEKTMVAKRTFKSFCSKLNISFDGKKDFHIGKEELRIIGLALIEK